MTTLKVPDMHCEKCVERITNALNAVNLSFQVSLENKTVTIDGDEDCVKTAIEELDDLGFEAVK
jgi:copper chaperone CopZ